MKILRGVECRDTAMSWRPFKVQGRMLTRDLPPVTPTDDAADRARAERDETRSVLASMNQANRDLWSRR